MDFQRHREPPPPLPKAVPLILLCLLCFELLCVWLWKEREPVMEWVSNNFALFAVLIAFLLALAVVLLGCWLFETHDDQHGDW